MAAVTIIGIRLRPDRVLAADLQKLLTDFGCSIRTRLGINSEEENGRAIIILEVCGNEEEKKRLLSQLQAREDIDVKFMTFD